jgi:hypothetical protein
MGGFMVSLVYGWHPLLEGVRRLKEQGSAPSSSWRRDGPFD